MCGARFLFREFSSNKKLWRRGGNLHASLQRKILFFQHIRNPHSYQWYWSGSAWIRIKLKGFIHIRIGINLISWIRIRIHIKVKSWIRIRIILQMKSHNVWEMILFNHVFKDLRLYLEARIQIRIKVKGRIRIRIKLIRIRNTGR